MAEQRQRLLELLRLRSFRQGTFTLASGAQSDFFIDVKQTALLAEGHALVGRTLLDVLHEMETERGTPFDAVAGVELGGCPLASAVAIVSWLESAQGRGRALDAIYVRKAAKDHGTQRLCEGGSHLARAKAGQTGAGARVAIVEDVVTTGGSTLRAAETLRSTGYEVCAVVAVVDRLEGGRAAIEAAGVPLRSLFTRHDFIPG